MGRPVFCDTHCRMRCVTKEVCTHATSSATSSSTRSTLVITQIMRSPLRTSCRYRCFSTCKHGCAIALRVVGADTLKMDGTILNCSMYWARLPSYACKQQSKNTNTQAKTLTPTAGWGYIHMQTLICCMEKVSTTTTTTHFLMCLPGADLGRKAVNLQCTSRCSCMLQAQAGTCNMNGPQPCCRSRYSAHRVVKCSTDTVLFTPEKEVMGEPQRAQSSIL